MRRAEVGRQAYLGPSLDLSNQKVRADDGRSVEKLMCCLRVLVEPRLALLPRLGSSSLDHVRHEGPGCTAETNERHLSLEPVPRLGEGVKDVAELLVDVDVGLEASHVGRLSDRGRERRSGVHLDRQTERLGNDEAASGRATTMSAYALYSTTFLRPLTCRS